MSHRTWDCHGVAISAMLHTTERRLVPRHRTSKVGKIILRCGHPGTVCIVRDISPAGGLLFVGNAYGLPEEFDPQIDVCIRRASRDGPGSA
jgi:hypothetical protein